MKPFIPLVTFIYLTALLNSRCTYGFSRALGHAQTLNNVDAITEFPSDYLEIETTTEGFSTNVTLDTRLVNDTDRYWRYSTLGSKKWFEYYNDTAHLIDHTSNETTCATVISDSANQLGERNGIWAACQDPNLPSDCLSVPPCYPEIKYSYPTIQYQFRTVKIYLSLQGLAIVRLTTRYSTENPKCFDYSRRKDPFSRCKHIQVNSTGEWEVVRSGFDGYDNAQFSYFTISLISRFKSDVALVDKIEATDLLLCSYAEGSCTTTSPGPTRSTSTTTTLFPPIETTGTGVTNSSTTRPTTRCSVPVTTKKLSMIRVSNISILDTRDDLTPIENGWEISPEIPRWLEYYNDSDSLKGHSENTSICANILPSSFGNLSDVVGIWGTCTGNSQSLNCSDKFNALCHPTINYNAPEGHFVFSVKVNFYFRNLEILRLYVGDECLDYSFEDTLSTCKYIKILQDGNYWRSFYWTSSGSSHYEKLASFRLELVSISDVDVLLIDKVQVEYRQCNNGNCTSEPTTTTTVDPTTDFTTETEYDCDEYEDTTITYATTNESDPPPVTTEETVTTPSSCDTSENPGTSENSGTSDNSGTSENPSTSENPDTSENSGTSENPSTSENPCTSDTDGTTTMSTTTPKGSYSTSTHSVVPTIFTLLVGVGAYITFFN